MNRTLVLFLLLASLLLLTGCWPVMESQTLAAAPTPTTAPHPAEKVAVSAPPPPTAAAAKPTAAPKPVAAATSAKPVAEPSPAAKAPVGASPPAVVATSVAGLPAVGASPAVSTDSRGAAPPDTLGVANSAGAAAAANAADVEAVALCGPGAILSIRAGQAAGRQATIAIPQVAASYQASVRGQPTFLNDAPYPNHVFTAVIWGSDQKQFQVPLTSWQDRALCVTGLVELYQQRPQIVVNSPSQLRASR